MSLLVLVFLSACGAQNLPIQSRDSSEPASGTLPSTQLTQSNSPSKYETTDNTTRQTTTTAITKLPVYVPGSIKLEKEQDGGWPFILTKRLIYYKVPGEIVGLIPGDVEKYLGDKFTEPKEMVLVTLVKRCKIQKEDFEKAIERERVLRIGNGLDLTLEGYELPNADIIYTFDNDIINEYYRRE